MLRNGLRHVSRNLLIFALSDMLGNFARSMIFPYASLYILALGGDAADIGLVATFAQLAGLLLLPVAGYITDRSNRVRILATVGYLSVLFQALNVLAPDWKILALAAFLSGTAVVSFPAYSALVADSLASDARGKGVGLMNTINSSLMFVGPYIAGMIIERFGTNHGMRFLYAAMVVLYFLATVLQARFLKEPPTRKHEKLHLQALLRALGQSYRGVPRLVKEMPSSLKALALVILLCLMAQSMTGVFWVVFATTRLGLSPGEWGVIMLLEALVKWLLLYPAGILADRWGRTAALVTALAMFTIVTPFTLLTKGYYGMLAVRLLLAIPFVLSIPAVTALMADLSQRAARGQIMAAVGQGQFYLGATGAPGGPAIGYLFIPGLMLASLSGGFLYTFDPALPWIISTVFGLISVLIAVLFIRDPRRSDEEHVAQS
jgi:MFS family permease